MVGASPEERAAVLERFLPRLRAGAYELSWLLERGYADGAARSGPGGLGRMRAVVAPSGLKGQKSQGAEG